ncbi:MerR family transcriptional regulator [Amycolatopsis vancoresmycina]|uniref:MerR family transcriptional regulator n=1 Tax=Amycolatopsis vancoresmycina DSM 44592 TaxID=1292037 RepID=R1HXV9_9PSEU|nr:MerR family transcriptional regulator [Amycolatopsis vancoresmycina]EOD63099.1 MerR family transcriptional regulator [Amycolatopsis vancoresmycina DSM 44592]
MSERRWSIGELAEAGGVTVRTLHHYDRIGLVSPGERTPAGHRRYREADVRRLYRVRTLCGMGLSLDEVAVVLRNAGDDPGSLRGLLTAQLADLEARAARIAESARRLRGLLDRLAEVAMPEPEQFLAALEPMSVDTGRYLSADQLAAITGRAAELGVEAVETLKTEWLGLFTRLRQHLRDGTPVDDPAVQDLATRWRETAAAFHPGDRRFEAATTALWEDNRAGLGRELDERLGWAGPGGAAEVIDYLRKARAAGESVSREEDG